MAFAGGLGVEMNLALVQAQGALDDATLLFSESNSRFLVEVEPSKEQAFVEAVGDEVPMSKAGRVLKDPVLLVNGRAGKPVIELRTQDLAAAWRSGVKLG
jgi:phosphoribosylformylglycinamidine synthase